MAEKFANNTIKIFANNTIKIYRLRNIIKFDSII